jgi:ATP-dependent DNA ligase
MLAKLARELPVGDHVYEPKWDGFRCIVFRRGQDVEMGSRNELSLARYFPELVDAFREVLPESIVLDGEVVVAGPSGLDFDALSQRVHPAESRVRLLARRTPASFVAFDMLALGVSDLRQEPFRERRRLLEGVLGGDGTPAGNVHLTPATRDRTVAQDWFERFEGAGLDGVVAKPAGAGYMPGKRAMIKVKHSRTAEFVVGGFRWYRAGAGAGEVGSLMLGLYDGGGRLCHVGVIGAFPAEQRRQLVEVLAPYRMAPYGMAAHGPGAEGEVCRAGGTGLEHPWAAWAEAPQGPGPRLPGARSRWSATKDLSFELLRPELVVEAAYEHLQGDRLRHTAQFRRWRPDRGPSSCTYDQLAVAVPVELAGVLGAAGDGAAGDGAAGDGEAGDGEAGPAGAGEEACHGR